METPPPPPQEPIISASQMDNITLFEWSDFLDFNLDDDDDDHFPFSFISDQISPESDPTQIPTIPVPSLVNSEYPIRKHDPPVSDPTQIPPIPVSSLDNYEYQVRKCDPSVSDPAQIPPISVSSLDNSEYQAGKRDPAVSDPTQIPQIPASSFYNSEYQVGKLDPPVFDPTQILPITVQSHDTSYRAGKWDQPESDQAQMTPIIVSSSPDNSERRVRKRDPRMTCSNFLAGKVPCSCPEVDAKMMEEEEEEDGGGGPGKKRARMVRGSWVGTARCQVMGCEADISELKGYHKRHKVCLRCATAASVVIDGLSKRYCQQCGKFHILSDFDEGKRSCRRKLERHNDRRRRKSAESKDAAEQEPQSVLSAEDVGCDDETEKDGKCSIRQKEERETLVGSEGHISTYNCSQNIQSDSGISFVASGEAHVEGEKDNSKDTHSPSYCDNRSAFSSVCPTGRISFKLYDWNPAEFPRRLRHQIFLWLSSMPVELEGYIRPGCIILTMFIAMPKFMWVKLLEDSEKYIHDFFDSPGNILSGRDSLLVRLNNMIFRISKDGTSVMKVKEEEHAPKLHYVHPMCFEAGKPLEFVACGSNLLQPKLRFLVSFAGKYRATEFYVSSKSGKSEDVGVGGCDHQLLHIYVPHTELDLFGPAFIEVENEFGLSNFIPILIGNKEICFEMKMMQQILDASVSSEGLPFDGTSSPCLVSVWRQKKFSEFTLDIAWLLQKPASRNMQCSLTTSQLQRFNCLLNFLIKNESIHILEKATYYMKIVTDSSLATCIAEADVSLFKKNMDNARDILCRKFRENGSFILHSSDLVQKVECFSQSFENNLLSVVPFTDQGMEIREKGKLGAMVSEMSPDRSESVPLLNKEVVMNVNDIKELPRKSCSRLLRNNILNSRPLFFVIAATAVCFGLCTVLLHPQKVGEFATTIRRCLFDNSL